MLAILSAINNLHKLFGRYLAGFGFDGHFARPHVCIDPQHARDPLQCLLDRVAAFVSNEAIYAEDENISSLGDT